MGGRKQNCVGLVGFILQQLVLFLQGSNDQVYKGKLFFIIIGLGDESFIVILVWSLCGYFKY